MHSDVSFNLLYQDNVPEEVIRTVPTLLADFPAGLLTPAGALNIVPSRSCRLSRRSLQLRVQRSLSAAPSARNENYVPACPVAGLQAWWSPPPPMRPCGPPPAISFMPTSQTGAP